MKIGIFGNEYQREDLILKIFNILDDYDAEIYIHKDFHEYISNKFGLSHSISGILENNNFDLDLAFSIGGDGTFLKTVTIIEEKNIPILGINTGRLGFLADIPEKNLESTLSEIMKGYYRVEMRSQLSLETNNNAFSDYNHALNEIAILKQDTASMLTIEAYIDGEHLTTYQSDGLIVATPTGSTAYSLSVGGPIMTPMAPNFMLVAIAPHSLTTRPLVIEDDSVLTFKIDSRNNHFLVSLDGRSEVLSTESVINIRKSTHTVKLAKRIGHTFYATLREKLMWGIDARSSKFQ